MSMSLLPVEGDFAHNENCFLAGLGLLDEVEKQMADLPQVGCETDHEFIKIGGSPFYVRTIHMPAGMLITSKIHRTTHAFYIPEGDVSVWTPKDGEVRLKGPYWGITTPSTKRLLFVHQDTRWTTFHQGDWKTVEEVEAAIIEPHENPGVPYFDSHNQPPMQHLTTKEDS